MILQIFILSIFLISADAVAHHDFYSCCKSRFMVPSRCANKCHYGMDFNAWAQQNLMELLGCVDHISSIVSCAGGWRDHKQCCQDNGVDAKCFRYCAIGQDDDQKFLLDEQLGRHCSKFANKMMQCMKAGVKRQPYLPTGLNIQVNGPTARISWKKVEGASSYRLEYKLANQGQWDLKRLRKNYYRLTNLQNGQYYVRVLAVGTSGNSVWTKRKSFTISNQIPFEPKTHQIEETSNPPSCVMPDTYGGKWSDKNGMNVQITPTSLDEELPKSSTCLKVGEFLSKKTNAKFLLLVIKTDQCLRCVKIIKESQKLLLLKKSDCIVDHEDYLGADGMKNCHELFRNDKSIPMHHLSNF